MVSRLDILPKGMFLELVSADLFGGKTLKADKYELADVKSHLNSASSHLNASFNSIDPLNVIFGRGDTYTNLLLAFAIASRINDPKMRSQAFTLIESYITSTGTSLFPLSVQF